MLVTLIGAKTSSGKAAWLDADAAASYQRMLAAGCPAGGITDAGRTYEEQVALFTARYTTSYLLSSMKDKRTWQGKSWWRKRNVASAATPGTSNHETGRALDLTGLTKAWVRAYGTQYGWIKDRVSGEDWHLEYIKSYDRYYRPTPAPIPTTPNIPTPVPTPTDSEEDDMLVTVKTLYTDLLDRPGTIEEWRGWIVPGRSETDTITAFLATTAESGAIRKAFRDFYGFEIDQAGFDYWKSRNLSVGDLRANIKYAAEHR